MKIPPDLLSATQNAAVDRILQRVIALFELTLPSRVRSYYLEGSYAEGAATVASDIDLYVVLKEPLSAEEIRVFWAVARSCHLPSSIPCGKNGGCNPKEYSLTYGFVGPVLYLESGCQITYLRGGNSRLTHEQLRHGSKPNSLLQQTLVVFAPLTGCVRFANLDLCLR
jgi:hypothetical protein